MLETGMCKVRALADPTVQDPGTGEDVPQLGRGAMHGHGA